MKRCPRLAITSCSCLVLLMSLASAGRADDADDLPVDARTRGAVIDSTIRFVRESYFDSLAGARLSREVRRARDAKRFERCVTASALCESLTATLRRLVPDQHLKVEFSVRPLPFDATTSAPSAEEVARQDEKSRGRNFGFERVERLPGNVGYLDLRRFERPWLAGETAAAAMAFLANSDAIIIDLRKNGGGYGDMANFLATYFFDGEPVHLRDVHDRPSQSMLQAWTTPYVPGARFTGKDLYILTGSRTFSAAEAFAYGMKSQGRATIVGATTRGGAHPTSMRQVDEHFAVFVPHAHVVDAITGGDWEGTGVAPDLKTPEDQALAVAHLTALQRIRERRGDAGADPDLTSAIEDATRAVATSPPPTK